MAIRAADVVQGIKLSESAYLMRPDEFDDLELAAARQWAVRVRGCIDAWMRTLPTSAFADA
jgi:hypothetical protein